jgi:hypothetical protein
MRRLVPALVVVSLMLFASPAAFAVGGSVTASFNHDTENLHGKVRSSETECSANRTVKVFLVTSDGRELQGKAHANDNGKWKLHLMDAHGTYVAVAPTYEAMHATCDRLTSDTVDVM